MQNSTLCIYIYIYSMWEMKKKFNIETVSENSCEETKSQAAEDVVILPRGFSSLYRPIHFVPKNLNLDNLTRRYERERAVY